MSPDSAIFYAILKACQLVIVLFWTSTFPTMLFIPSLPHGCKSEHGVKHRSQCPYSEQRSSTQPPNGRRMARSSITDGGPPSRSRAMYHSQSRFILSREDPPSPPPQPPPSPSE
ncbi:hypothetical protein BKA80DRAFT_73924 [Phyllosticta citrichinensis]